MSGWTDSATALGCSSGDTLSLSSVLAGSRAVVLTFVGPECAGRDLTIVRAIDALVAAACDRAGAQSLKQVILGLSTSSASSKAVVSRVAEECPRSYIFMGETAAAAEWCGLGRVAALPEAVLCDVVSLGEGVVRLQPRYTEMGADLKVNPQSAAFSADRFPDGWPRNCTQVRVARQELGLSRRVVLPPSSGSAAAGGGGSGGTSDHAAAVPALPFFAAYMAPEALLQLPFYSGDPVLVKRIGEYAASAAPATATSAAATSAAASAGSVPDTAAASAAGASPTPVAAARPRAALRSLVVYMCPPPEVVDDDHDGAAGGAGSAGSAAGAAASDAAAAAASAPAGSSPSAEAPGLLLAPSVCADLGIGNGDFVCLLPYEDLPPAREIRLTLLDGGQKPSAAEVRAMTEAAKATLGLPGADVSGSAAATAGAPPEARVTAAISELYEAALDAASAPVEAESSAAVFHVSDSQRQYLEDLVRRGECRYSPVVEGQTLPVARAGGGSVSLKVALTEPRHTAVMVEPDTVLRWV